MRKYAAPLILLVLLAFTFNLALTAAVEPEYVEEYESVDTPKFMLGEAEDNTLDEEAPLLEDEVVVEEPEEDFTEPEPCDEEEDVDQDYEVTTYYWEVPYDMTELEYERDFAPTVNKEWDKSGMDTIEFVGPHTISASDSEELEALGDEMFYGDESEEVTEIVE